MHSPTTHYRTCNLCEAMCGLAIDVADGQIKAIRGDNEDPFSRGHICPKAVALQDIYHDPDRLKYPVRRTADGWERIAWDEAFDEVVTRLRAVQAEHGGSSVAVYLGNPNVHNYGSFLFIPPFIRALRTRQRYSATSVDQLPSHFAAYYMFGHQLLLPLPDVDRTDYFLMLGANPLASNGSLMTAPGIEGRLKALQARGGRLVVVDPRRTETAALADEHHFIRPGGDVLLLLALLHVLFAEDLLDPGRLAEFSDGVDEVADLVAPYPPERAAAATGIDAATIRRLARDFSAAPRAVAYGRIGVSTQAFGGVCQWLINLLNVLTGNLDRPGGAMFSRPAVDGVALTGRAGRTGSHGRWTTRVRGLPEFGGELPVSALAEEMLAPGKGQVRAFVTMAGNPVLSTPNGAQLDEALAGLDFMVAIDIYINETTRHADIILPPTTGLETDHYDLVFHHLAVRNTAKYSPALFEPDPEQRHDWQILKALRQRLLATAPARSRRGRVRDPFARYRPDQLIDLTLRLGPYGLRRRDGQPSLKLRHLRAAPHGLDLGPLQSCLPRRLFTPDKRINLAPAPMMADMERVAAAFSPETGRNGHLQLIGRRQLRSNNSWMHNSARLVRGRERCTLLIHPDDAAARGIAAGAAVTVTGRVGTITLPAEVSDEMMPGVVSIPHGWGHDRAGVRLTTAQAHAGASLNDVTDERLLDELTGNAAFSGVPVTVAPASPP